MSQGHSACYVQAALILLLDGDVGWPLVDSDAKSLQFIFDDSLVCERFVDVKNNEDQMACLRNRNDLATSTAAVFGTLDDTWQVDNLERGTVVHDLTWYTCQGREFVRSCLGVLAC